LPQAFDQEFDDRRRVFGAINPAIAQYAGQERFATIYVGR
jgi:hypothetical protein